MTSMNDVNLEEGRVEVEVFTQTDAALAVLREQYSTVPDFETSEGYDQGKKALKKITGYRTTLEKERKRIKAPYLKAGQIIDAEAKRITEALVELEEPLKQAKAVVDEREKRMKAERIAKLQAKIDAIKAKVREARGQDSATVAAMIEEVDAIDTQGEFYELTDDAVRAQREVLDELGGIYSDRLQQEQAEEDRRKAEQARMEQEAQQRINDSIQKIRMLPIDFMGASASAIQEQIDKMTMQYPSASQFGDRYPEAEQAHEQSMDQLRGLLAQAKQAEENAAKAEAFKEAAATQGQVQGKAEPEQLSEGDVATAGGTVFSPEDSDAWRSVGDVVQPHRANDIPTDFANDIPTNFKADTADRLAAHSLNAELLQLLSDWCDKWDLSMAASQELGEIIEAHCLK